MLKSVCPILPSRNFDETSAFYGQLGFKEVARFEMEGYAIFTCDQVELHFFRHPNLDRQTSEHGAFLRVEDAVDLSRRFETLNLPDAGIPRFAKAENKPWGVCELELVDPNGNLLRMGHVVEGNSAATNSR